MSATNENGVSCVTSRTVTPPPSPVSGCSASWVSWAGAGRVRRDRVSRRPPHETMTTVAAMAVSNIVGARLRDDTSRCYVCFYCYL